MTPLEAAKALVDHDLLHDGAGGEYLPGCILCLGNWSGTRAPKAPFVHEQDCPARLLPQIVAALEAATEVLRLHHMPSYRGIDFFSSNAAYARERALQALVAALKGDEA